ncbi:MAG: hypothetical protein ACREBU_09335, partial [Nitrososphaera sp.]
LATLMFFLTGMFIPGAQHLALAQGLTVASYIDLTIARLELAKTSLEHKSQPADAAAVADLWQRYQTTSDEYIAFRGRFGREVDSYLAENPDLAARVDELSGAIKALVEQAERQ